MNAAKIGLLIAKLRKEKGLTQKDLADALGVSNKTVSKWECGMGCADLSLWPGLSELLGADIAQMMEGEMTLNKPDVGKVVRTKFYVCPACGNLLTSTGGASIFCCGRKLEPAEIRKPDEAHQVVVDTVEDDYYITFAHPMTKEHYISFFACVEYDRIMMVRLYPEQSGEVRFPKRGKARILYGCSQHGIFQV